MIKIYSYNPVNFNRVSHVELINSNSQEWTDYLEKINNQNSKTQAQIEREKLIKNNPTEFKRFERDVKKFLNNQEPLVKKVENYVDHLRQASFKNHGENKYGSIRISTSGSYDKKHIINELPWRETHLQYNKNIGRIYFDKKSFSKVKNKLKNRGYSIVDEESYKKSKEFGLPLNYRNKDHLERIDAVTSGLSILKSGDTRKEASRIAWRRHLDEIDDYHYNRAEAYLRDLNSGIGKEAKAHNGRKSGIDFEKSVKEKLENTGFESLNTVFKIKTDSGDIFYKQMDHHSKVGSTHVVFEIFKRRDKQKKKQQINDYITLLNKCVESEVKGVEITTLGIESDSISKKNIVESVNQTKKYGFSTLKVSEGDL